MFKKKSLFSTLFLKTYFKNMKRILFLFISLLFIQPLLAQDDQFEGKQEENDMEALRKWIREKKISNC